MKYKKQSAVLATYEGCMGKLIYPILYQKILIKSTLLHRYAMRSQMNEMKTCILSSYTVLIAMVKEVDVMAKNGKQTSKSVAESALAQTRPSGKK